MSTSASERIGRLAVDVMEDVEQEAGELGMIVLVYEVDLGDDRVRYGAANEGGQRRRDVIGLLEMAKRSVMEDAVEDE